MPKVTMWYKGEVPVTKLLAIGGEIRCLVMALLNERHISVSAVDWIPLQYPLGSLVAIPVSIELETIGFAHRLPQLNENSIRKLKTDILNLFGAAGVFADFNPDDPLIWVKPQNPVGVHV